MSDENNTDDALVSRVAALEATTEQQNERTVSLESQLISLRRDMRELRKDIRR